MFCTIIGVAVAATYGRQGGQASLAAYQAAVPLAGDSYEPQKGYRSSTNRYQKQQQTDYIPPAYRTRNTYAPSEYQPQRTYKPQRYQPQRVYKYPVSAPQEQYAAPHFESQNSYSQDDFQDHQEYKPEVFQQQNRHMPTDYVRQQQRDYKTADQQQDYRPLQNYEHQQNYPVNEDLGPDMSNFQYQVPIYDAMGFGNAAVRTIKST